VVIKSEVNLLANHTVSQQLAALLDLIYLSLHKIGQAQYEKKASLIISDGRDNHSRKARIRVAMVSCS
jgi:hypothetical protein